MSDEKQQDVQEKPISFYSKNKKNILVAAAVVATLAIGAGGYYYTVKNKVESWNSKIYTGVSVGNVDLSGMSKEEAFNALNEEYSTAILDKKLLVKADTEQIEINFGDLSPEYNMDEVVNEALALGKAENILKQNSYINKGMNTNLELEFKYSEEKLKEYEGYILEQVNQDAQNASISVKGGEISVKDGVDGRKINEEEMDKLIKESINGELVEVSEVEIPVEVVKPTITKDELSKINGVIGSFTSNYSTNSTEGRATNIYLSTKAINGTLLMPGETFSFNDIVGKRTAARGYKEAATFVGNQVVDGLGGGICQTSTAINRAIIRAGLKPTERYNHSMKTSYSEYGLDAAVAWGAKDFKFKNTYDSPIYIEGITTGNRRIIFNIYGNTANKNGKTYDLVATKAVLTSEASVKRVEDPNLEKGKEVWETKPVNAYKSSSSIVTYKDGKEIDRQFLANHNYVKADGVLKVGTKEPAAPVKPVVPPTQPETPESEKPME